MKSKLLIAALAASLSLLGRPCLAADAVPAAADAAPAAGDARQELQQLVAKVNAQLQAGKHTEADLAGELQEFDALLAKHRAEKTDDVAQILLMKAMLYVEVFENPAKGAELIRQLKVDFPDTKQGQDADRMLAALAHQEEAAKTRSALAVGKPFPDFAEKDLAGQPLSLGAYRGKVVLVDFWATWCGPCVNELPNVLAAYKKYHDQGFEIVGVSLDQDEGKLTSFMKEQGVTWAQYFDGKGWDNKLAVKYGIQSIPATFLLDGNGTIIAQDLRGEALGAELARRLGGK
jgi:thiol-disulfide isomerase/thioredoxin